jgi:hypothetical protein
MISGANDPPNTPSLPTGPSTGAPADTLTFSTSSTDPDGDQIKYGWDWDGDGTVDEWSGLQNSGTTDTRLHTWVAEGTYQVQVKAEDEHGAQSAFSSIKTVIISANTAPSKPVISGPSSGRADRSYSYSASTTDTEGDNMYYWFDWGDGTNTGWVGPFTSGQSATESHIWNTQGSFSIKVKAKDTAGLESIWSDPLSVTMPKTSVIRHQILRFLNNHPIMFPYLQILLEDS